jgi:hypothetical protein
MQSVASLGEQRDIIADALSEAQRKVRAFVGETHTAAKFAWFAVGCLILSAVIWTGWHNWNLYARGANTETGKAIAIVPALLLDGSIVLLLILLLTYFKERLQWTVAVVFNALLFFVNAANTSLDFSMSANEPVGPEMQTYLRWGVVISFLGTLAMWEVLIHLDPAHRMKMQKAELEMKALNAANKAQLRTINLSIKRQTDALEYYEELQQKMHDARMHAVRGDLVQSALTDYEESEAVSEAMRIRSAAPKALSR